jgi:NADH-quinone oxidoreductase subunit L
MPEIVGVAKQAATGASALAQPFWFEMPIGFWAALFLFIGACGKSAQIPLYVWLPDAMAGPTPVSALIHAATMVTAGVYMVARSNVLFQLAHNTSALVAIIGCITAVLAATIAIAQTDIKKVLAYSTVSQLGYMFLAMGVGAYAAGIFHLYTHAFFKALLFLGSGAVIHALHGEQDLRNMGGLKKHLPITYWTFLIGAIAIAGIPPLAGFFSKDEILWKSFSEHHYVLWGIGMLTAFLTATYMFRLVFLTFHGERRHDAPVPEHPEEEEPAAHPGVVGAGGAHGATKHAGHGHGAHDGHLHDAPPAMAFALIVLAIGSVLAGFIGIPHALGGSNWIETFLHPAFVAPGAPHEAAAVHAEAATELMLMALSVGLAVAGIGLAWYFFVTNRAAADRMAASFSGIHRVLLNKYYVDEIYDTAIVQPIKIVSTGGLWKGVDAGGIDGAVNGVGLGISGGSSVLRRLQTGSIRTYAASLFLGVVLVLGYYLY